MPETVACTLNILSHLIPMTILLFSQISRWGLEIKQLVQGAGGTKIQWQMALIPESSS